MKKCNTIIGILLSICLLVIFCSCTKPDAEPSQTLTIAYQGGIGYAPIYLMEKKQMVESVYQQKTGKTVKVIYQKLDSGADINTGIIGGTIDIGCMGIAPAISAVASGVKAKIMSGLCSQSHGLMCSNDAIQSLSDIKDEQIALVNIGSIQHIILAMAAEKELGDAHAFDNNIVKMSHAEGYAALQAGVYPLHLTSSPYIVRERENEKFHEIKEVNAAWPDGNTFLVALGAEKLQNENAELFVCVQQAFEEAIDEINTQPDAASEIIAPYLGQDANTTLSDLQEESSSYFPSVKGITKVADFMAKYDFISRTLNFDEMVFSGVTGD